MAPGVEAIGESHQGWRSPLHCSPGTRWQCSRPTSGDSGSDGTQDRSPSDPPKQPGCSLIRVRSARCSLRFGSHWCKYRCQPSRSTSRSCRGATPPTLPLLLLVLSVVKTTAAAPAHVPGSLTQGRTSVERGTTVMWEGRSTESLGRDAVWLQVEKERDRERERGGTQTRSLGTLCHGQDTGRTSRSWHRDLTARLLLPCKTSFLFGDEP